MKPFANVFVFAFFGLATLVMGCASSPTTGGETRTCGVSPEMSDPNRVSHKEPGRHSGSLSFSHSM